MHRRKFFRLVTGAIGAAAAGARGCRIAPQPLPFPAFANGGVLVKPSPVVLYSHEPERVLTKDQYNGFLKQIDRELRRRRAPAAARVSQFPITRFP